MFSHLFEKNTPLPRNNEKKKRIVVIGLDLSVNHELSGEYSAKSAYEKIRHMESVIRAACERLTVEEPYALWVMVWREYGISGYMCEDPLRPLCSAISSEEKTYYVHTFRELAEQYAPNLVIAAGTVLTYKSGQTKEKAQGLLEYYRQGRDFLKLSDYSAEKNRVKQFIKGSDPKAMATILKHMAYFFWADNAVGIAKKNPFNEENYNTFNEPLLFQPAKLVAKKTGKKINAIPVVSVPHPCGEIVRIGAEICLEHSLQWMKHYAESTGYVPDVTLIMGDSIVFEPERVISPFSLFVDSQEETVAAFNPAKLQEEALDIVALHCNALENDFVLKTPCQVDLSKRTCQLNGNF